MKYDLIIVGSGLYGAVSAYVAHEYGLKCLVLERRHFIGGNIRDEQQEGIFVHKYGPHIFHTDDKEVWTFANKFAEFNHFRYCPLARNGKNIYHLPFNMNTFHEVYGVTTPSEAKLKLQQEHEHEYYEHPINLEQQAISLVGRRLYELFIKGYTEKQWGASASELPAFIIKRIPLRFEYNNNYFNDRYQGIPIGGYSNWIKKMLNKVEVKTDTDFLDARDFWECQTSHIIFTGAIDELYEYQLGALEYRSLRFEEELYQIENFQGCAAVNELSAKTPYTRTIEHKHFNFGNQPVTIITREYPAKWQQGKDAFYPINNKKNNYCYKEYRKMAAKKNPLIQFGGRLGNYEYYNMDEVIRRAIRNAYFIIRQFKKQYYS